MAFSAMQEVFAHFDKLLNGFAVAKSIAIGQVLNPSVSMILGISWMFYGVAHLIGQAEEPFIGFVTRTFKQATILGVALGTTMYSDWIITTFQDSPVALSAAFSMNSNSPNTLNGSALMLDTMIDNVITVSGNFFRLGGLRNLTPYFLGGLVWLIGIVVAIISGALILLAKVSTAILLSVGPLFVLGLLFEATKSYFSSFINALVNYGMVMVLTSAANAFVLDMYSQYISSTAGLSTSAGINEVTAGAVAGIMGILVLLQVTSLASGLAGGMSLSSPFGLMASGAKKALNLANKVTGGQGRSNQREAKNRIDVNRRMDALMAKEAAKKKSDGELRENKAPRQEMPQWKTGTGE